MVERLLFSFFVLRFHSAVPPLNSAESLNNALKRYKNISSSPTSPLHLSSPGDSRDSNYIFSPFLRSPFSCLVFSAPAVTLKQMKWHLEYKTIKKNPAASTMMKMLFAGPREPETKATLQECQLDKFLRALCVGFQSILALWISPARNRIANTLLRFLRARYHCGFVSQLQHRINIDYLSNFLWNLEI